MKYVQHGDVLIFAVSELPKKAKKIAVRPLALGEVTGHAHRILDEDQIEMYEVDGVTYLKVIKASSVVHEEHKPIELDPGLYKIGIVREYDPFAEEARNVAD